MRISTRRDILGRRRDSVRNYWRAFVVDLKGVGGYSGFRTMEGRPRVLISNRPRNEGILPISRIMMGRMHSWNSFCQDEVCVMIK